MTIPVLALTRYSRMGASSRVRFLQYIPDLKRHGFNVDVQSLFSDAYLIKLYSGEGRSALDVLKAMAERLKKLMSQSHYDLVWLQRELMPFIPFAIEHQLLKGRPLVVDFDDAHHLYYKNISSTALRRMFSNKTDDLIMCADAVVVGNETLADYAARAGAKDISVVPSAVDVKKYQTLTQRANRPDRLALGWIGTPVTAAQSLPLISHTLREFLADSGATCLLMGADPSVDYGFPAEHFGWSEASEVEFMTKIDIGLCPLEDTQWNRGKSGYKIIQYMAAGKPSVVSPVGIAAEIVSHKKTGLQCETELDWLSALRELGEDQYLRSDMGAQAQAKALMKYDVPIAAKKISEIFKSVMRK
ncbi:MAG: glycosyltransferase family 4 protein [Rhodospirillaceae bacterium]|jgi:glycosyltransferase involved in cell wall biosynthesis